MAKKKIIGITLIAILAISLISSCFRMFGKGVYIGDSFYYTINNSLYIKNALNYIDRRGDDTFKLVSYTGGKNATIQVIKTDTFVEMHIKYLDDPIEHQILWTGYNNYDYNHKIADGIYKIYKDQTESIPSIYWLGVVAGTIMYIIGAASFLYPDETNRFFNWRDRWYYNFYYNTGDRLELSDVGRIVYQFSGVIVMLIAIGFISGLIFQLIK